MRVLKGNNFFAFKIVLSSKSSITAVMLQNKRKIIGKWAKECLKAIESKVAIL